MYTRHYEYIVCACVSNITLHTYEIHNSGSSIFYQKVQKP